MAIDHRFPDLEAERSEPKVLSEAGQADAILIGARFQLHAVPIARLRCRTIVRYGVGVDNIDVGAARRSGIAVGFVPGYCVEKVSTHALGPAASASPPAGRGCGRLPDQRLSTLRLGRIGREHARKALALGLAVAAHDPLVAAERMREAGIEPLTLEELLARSNFVSFHVPLTAATWHLLDARRIASMKAGAVLINVGRGGLIDETALSRALCSSHLAGAGLDVTELGPLPADHPLRSAPNLLLTPHVAWCSVEARRELQTKAAKEVARALRGRPLRNPA